VKRALLVALFLAAAVGASAANGPNPIAQPPLDGCARDPAAIGQGLAPELVYVNGASQPQWLAGVVAGSVPPVAGSDFDIDVRPDSSSSFLLAEGSARLRAARDATAFPAFAWPDPGDRVQLLGSWVWNCTKWKPAGERTELHPFRAAWVQRSVSARSPWGETEGDVFVSTDSTEAGPVADCALQAKGDQAALAACLATQARWQDVTAPYRFVLPAPPRPPGAGKLYARVVDTGSVGGAAASVNVQSGAAVVTAKLAALPGVRLVLAKQVFLGWTKVPATELPQHLRISLRSPVGSSICDAAGVWGPCPAHRTIDVYLPRGTPWRLAIYAQHATITHRFPSPVASLGLHRDRSTGYAVTYVVTRVNDALKRAAVPPR
jgi:hypothetical protein